jgi:hypothetical protein
MSFRRSEKNERGTDEWKFKDHTHLDNMPARDARVFEHLAITCIHPLVLSLC